MNSKILESLLSAPETLKSWSNPNSASNLLESLIAQKKVVSAGCNKGETETYFTLLKVWVTCVEQLSPNTALAMVIFLGQGKSFTKLIDMAKDAYDCFSHGTTCDNLFRELLTVDSIYWSDMVTALLLLTRYTPSEATAEQLHKATIRDFKVLQADLRALNLEDEVNPLSTSKVLDLNFSGHILWDRFKHVACRTIPTRRENRHPAALSVISDWLYAELRYYNQMPHFEATDYVFTDLFTPGVTTSWCRNPKTRNKYFKAKALIDTMGICWSDVLRGITYGNKDYAKEVLGNEISHTPMTVMTVPKSATKRRLISPCSPLAAAAGKLLYRMSSRLIEQWNRSDGFLGSKGIQITFKDQLQNREAAYIGSLRGQYATIDLKNASDRNRQSIIYAVFPEYASIQQGLIPLYYELEGSVYPLGSWMLAGDPNTYNSECIYFSIAVAYAIHLVDKYNPTDEVIPYKAKVCGDDIVIHTRYLETLLDVLPIFGCVVNGEKSFADFENLFRESCGGFFKEGFSIQPTFYPRGGIKLTDKGKINTDARWKYDYATDSSSYLSDLDSAIAFSNALVKYPAAWLIYTNYVLEHTDVDITSSSDYAETGLRNPFLHITKKCSNSPHARIVHTHVFYKYDSRITYEPPKGPRFLRGGKKTSNFGEFTNAYRRNYSYDVSYFSKESSEHILERDHLLKDGTILKKGEKLHSNMPRYYKAMQDKNPLADAYLRWHTDGIKPEKTEDYLLFLYLEEALLEDYLLYGPSYPDPLLETLHVSERRRF